MKDLGLADYGLIGILLSVLIALVTAILAFARSLLLTQLQRHEKHIEALTGDVRWHRDEGTKCREAYTDNLTRVSEAHERVGESICNKLEIISNKLDNYTERLCDGNSCDLRIVNNRPSGEQQRQSRPDGR